jgi:ATP-dependent Clp protease ATP-binding subunit ClpA
MVQTVPHSGLMFERFTNRARHVVVLAQEEARRLQHNYIGTEHLLLGLLGEPHGLAARALDHFGVSLAGVREEVTNIIGIGKKAPKGHIPFTPRAKKVLELSLREALQLGHNYIGTEHILLGIIRERDGVAAQIIAAHAGDPAVVRTAVLNLLPAEQSTPGQRWLRRHAVWLRHHATVSGEPGEPEEREELRTTPAADTSLEEAAQLAGPGPVGSHHLLLAALADANTAAARALVTAGVDLDQVREALRSADVTDTSDEQPEERGRRHMLIRVTDGNLTIEAADEDIVGLGRSAVEALGDQAGEGGTIRGDLPLSASLAGVWQALHDSLEDIRRRAEASRDTQADQPEKGKNRKPA